MIPTVARGSWNPKRDLVKKRALEIFNLYGSLNPRAWAIYANFFPVRSSYSYLLRLHRFGLLNRNHDSFGRIVYSLSDRGRERLRWLTLPNSPKQSQTRPQEITHGITVPNAF